MDVLKVLRDAGAYLEGHFLLHSGRHSGQFLQCAQALQYPKTTRRLCNALARTCRDLQPQTVIGPAVGGILIAYEVARWFDARGLYAEKREGRLQLARGFSLGRAERCLVVDDVSTTGDSVRQVIDIVRLLGAEPVGVGVFVDRSGGTIDYGLPARALLTMNIETWTSEECPLCAQNLPLIDPDTRKPLKTAPREF